MNLFTRITKYTPALTHFSDSKDLVNIINRHRYFPNCFAITLQCFHWDQTTLKYIFHTVLLLFQPFVTQQLVCFIIFSFISSNFNTSFIRCFYWCRAASLRRNQFFSKASNIFFSNFELQDDSICYYFRLTGRRFVYFYGITYYFWVFLKLSQ